MAGKGTISVNQTPQYGDKTALDSASKALTTTPMTGNPVPTKGAGRPAAGGPPAPAGPPAAIPSAHKQAADALARKAWAAQFWADLAARPDAGPRTKMYAQVAQRALQEALKSTRNQTPYFE